MSLTALPRALLPRALTTARPGVFLAILLLVTLATFAIKLRSHSVFACPAGYGTHAYLSDCNALNYGDYDHGSFWFGLEPAADLAARQAEVIFVGNSRIQFALGTPVAAQWFDARKIPFFSLGFSHYESVTFFTPVLQRVQPRPKAYVINADRFFAEWLSPVARRVVQERDARARYVEKRFWQRAHKTLCTSLGALCGHQFAVYRDVGTGQWFTSGIQPDERVPVADAAPTDVEQWPHFTELATAFVDRLSVDRRCIVLTIVPSPKTKRAEAQAMAQALGVPFIAPEVSGLTTFDGSHLDKRSAALWSAAFLAAAGPVLERCAGH